MTKSVLFPQKKTSSRLAALWQLLKTALCAIALLLTLAAAMASVWAQNTWENLEFEQIIGNLNIRPQDMDIFAFSPELKYYIAAAAMLYLFLLAVCSNRRAAPCLGRLRCRRRLADTHYPLLLLSKHDRHPLRKILQSARHNRR